MTNYQALANAVILTAVKITAISSEVYIKAMLSTVNLSWRNSSGADGLRRFPTLTAFGL